MPVPTNRPGHPRAAARPGLRHRGREVARDRRGSRASCTSQGRPGADRHAVDRQVGDPLASCSTAAGIEHKVLNAHEIAAEAEIVAQAGQPGKVTVATNMAGRGTDIKLGPGVAETGGLHVICTELHDSARIDRQLMGRCGRQGDPGTVRQYMSLDDDVHPHRLRPRNGRKDDRPRQDEPRHAAELPGPAQAGPATRSSGATSATASSCCITRRSGRRCRPRWGRTRIWTRRTNVAWASAHANQSG